jgi:hypothetical protein
MKQGSLVEFTKLKEVVNASEARWVNLNSRFLNTEVFIVNDALHMHFLAYVLDHLACGF